jgi:Na+-driven multidrug efflux pump
MKERSLVEMLMVSLVSFITFVLFYQTIFTLTNSVSNSGQLNISSLAIIVVIDQLAIRVGFGLLALATLKIL